MIGRPSQPDLDNTSVGKPGDIGACEEFSRVPGLWEGGFFIARMPLSAVDLARRSTMKGSLYEHPDKYKWIR